MLSSIHPLGERARSNRWWLTVGAFTAAAVAAGALLGTGAAWLGSFVGGGVENTFAVAAVVVVAAVADLARVPIPWLHRQVNERWIGAYRGWVYGAAFGAQLGVGFSTYVVTWAVPALVIVLAMLADPGVGLATGIVFGLGRSIPLWAAGWIDRPSRLGRFHQGMARIGRPVHVAAAVGVLLAGSMLGASA